MSVEVVRVRFNILPFLSQWTIKLIPKLLFLHISSDPPEYSRYFWRSWLLFTRLPSFPSLCNPPNNSHNKHHSPDMITRRLLVEVNALWDSSSLLARPPAQEEPSLEPTRTNGCPSFDISQLSGLSAVLLQVLGNHMQPGWFMPLVFFI